MMNRIVTAIVLSCGIGSAAFASTNIELATPFAWGEGIGWINLYADGTNGVVVTTGHLSGFAWSESAGWIFFGDGPDNTLQYSQAAGDTGVNNDGSGNLTGFAWGESIGWINFDTSGVGGSQVTINMMSGQFDGFAWCESMGWINMNSGYGVTFNANTSVNDWTILEK